VAEYDMTARVLRYHLSGSDAEELEQEIAVKAYLYIQKTRNMDFDEAGDFFVEYYQKIVVLKDSFIFLGLPFEAYLYSSIRWNMLRYRRKLNRNRWTERLCHFQDFWEVAQSDPMYSPAVKYYQESEDSEELQWINRRRFVYLALREAEYLDHQMVEEIVRFARVDRRWFLNCVTALKERMDRRRQRLVLLRDYYHRCYAHYYSQQLVLLDCFDPERKNSQQRKLAKVELSFHRARQRLRKLHLHPTNQEISDVLHVPKGTIDSGIYYLKKEFFQRQEAA